MRKQHGLSLSGLLFVSAVLISVVLLGFKLLPAYTEYLSVRKAVREIASDPESRNSVREIQAAFSRRAAVDDIRVVDARDLEITKQGGQVQIAAAWSVKVPLFMNLSACLDFEATSEQ